MEKIINIGGKEVKMRASALIPRLYRFRFERDIIRDMTALKKAFNKKNELPEDATEEQKQDAALSEMNLMIFENVAYIMAKHADPSIPDDPNEWLDGFEMFSIYEIFPEILQMWNLNNETTSKPKKNKRNCQGENGSGIHASLRGAEPVR